MPRSLLGTEVRRLEDPDLLTGRAKFVADLPVEGLAHACFVRSPFAHSTICSIDTGAARAVPGVVDVFMAGDLRIGPFHPFLSLNAACVRPPLAETKVRFIGEPVVLVVAESAAVAADVAELVVDYEPFTSVTDPEGAVTEGAPLQFEELGSNVVAGLAWLAPDDPLGGAARVVRARLENQRIATAPMEGDVVVAMPIPDEG